MKKYLPVLALSFLAVACNSKPETAVKSLQSTQASSADTAGLAQFQHWKAQSELTAAQPQPQTKVAEAAPVKTVEVIREVRVVERPAPVQKKRPKPQPVPEETSPESPAATETAGTGGGTAESTDANEAKAPAAGQETVKKEGWSKAAKGATIGAAGGAVIGAVINKRNPAVGAVIGGVLGAGAGYGIGKEKDKKDGRTN